MASMGSHRSVPSTVTVPFVDLGDLDDEPQATLSSKRGRVRKEERTPCRAFRGARKIWEWFCTESTGRVSPLELS